MEKRVPRFLLAGANSGCGKTTVTCAVLRALVDRGLRVGACKCGPDYIDPMFHSQITGGRSANLDPFFFDPDTARYLLARNSGDRDVTVIEGVMGYYDGAGPAGDRASTYEAARSTASPVVLVIGARGMGLSALAVLQGFLDFQPNSGIRGVIFNQCTAGTYRLLAETLPKRFGGRVRPLGYLPPMRECSLESRHLGLVTAGEVTDLEEKLQRLARKAEETIDLDGLLHLAAEAPALTFAPPSPLPSPGKARIAVARDKAFCFYYEDSLDVLRDMGAELVDFSPLADAALPPDIQGLYLGGGYPELYARQLSENATMRTSIRTALAGGLPCIAECGGFMYLTEAIGDFPMVGHLPGKCFDAGRLVRFGYVTLTARRDNLLCRAGESIRGHEFHHWDCTDPGDGFLAEKATGRSWPCAVATDRLYAGYPHFHFRANPAFARRFYETCLKERHTI